MSTDKDWERWGSANPYFGVISDPKFLGSKLGSDLEKDFYQSGQADIARVMRHIHSLGGDSFDHAIDFGCGTGRLTIPLASYAKKVMGLDVSPSVIKEAKKKTPKQLKSRVSYHLSNDQLDGLPKEYDLVHSYIVLQHVHPRRGEQIIKKLLANLQPGGFAALHITFAHEAPWLKKTVIWMRNHFVPLHYAFNVAKGRPWNMPRMRMHLYDLEKITRLLRASGIVEAVHLTTDHGGYIGAMIIGRKE